VDRSDGEDDPVADAPFCIEFSATADEGNDNLAERATTVGDGRDVLSTRAKG
jgi:hypothetical protein